MTGPGPHIATVASYTPPPPQSAGTGGWYATCTCGWVSAMYLSVRSARAAQHRHTRAR